MQCVFARVVDGGDSAALRGHMDLAAPRRPDCRGDCAADRAVAIACWDVCRHKGKQRLSARVAELERIATREGKSGDMADIVLQNAGFIGAAALPIGD